MARIEVEVKVVFQLDIPDKLAERMTMNDLIATADMVAHRTHGTAPVVIVNEVVGNCQFAVRPFREERTPENITLGVYYEPSFPLLDGDQPNIV